MNEKHPIKEEKKLRPSYASIGQAEEALNIFKRINPKKIDADFVVSNNLATRPNSPRILDFYRWLGVIDPTGNVRPEAITKLRMVGTEREDFVIRSIKIGYKDLFEEVNVEQATKDDIINFFIRNYSYTKLTATFAASLFISLCRKYNIQVSESLRTKSPSSTDKGIAEHRMRNTLSKKINDPNKALITKDGPSSKTINEDSIPEDKRYIITIKSKDGKNYFFPIANLEDMEELDAILTIIRKKIS